MSLGAIHLKDPMPESKYLEHRPIEHQNNLSQDTKNGFCIFMFSENNLSLQE